MPIVLVGEDYRPPAASFGKKKFDYDYPYDLDLSPQSRLHSDIVGRLTRLADDGFSAIQARHPDWTKVDDMMTVFIQPSEKEKAIKSRRYTNDSHGEQHMYTRPVSIVVPYSYATHETLMTYMTQAFLSAPIFQYDPKGPDDQEKAKLLQLVVNAQSDKFKAFLQLHTMFSDCFKYGIGQCTFDWKEHYGRTTVQEPIGMYDENGMYLGTRTEERKEERLLFEGSAIVPIDPYRYIPDPNVSAHRQQESEFIGWTNLITYYKKLAKEAEDTDSFNAKYIGKDSDFRQWYSRYTPDVSHRDMKKPSSIKTNFTNYLTDLHMFVELIPEEWGLPGHPQLNPDSDLPEKWLFTLTNDILLTRATRHNLDHGMYPIAAAAPDYDGYSNTPIGRMEMLHGLQDGMNWLYNSHMTNVRKVINDTLIVDPSMVVMSDLEDPDSGIVRLRRSAWGRGVNDAVKQLAVTDITRANIGDSQYVMDMMQRVSAAVDAVQGIVRSGGERRSATEYRMTVNNAMSRLEHIAKIISSQAMQDISYMMAAHTQQFMREPVYARLTGEWQKKLQKIYGSDGVWISPQDIQVDYDVQIRDGSVPTTGIANADLMVQMFQIVAADPELRQTFDITKMYGRIAEVMGDANAYDFVRQGGDVQAATLPDEQVQDQVAQGNLVPLNAA